MTRLQVPYQAPERFSLRSAWSSGINSCQILFSYFDYTHPTFELSYLSYLSTMNRYQGRDGRIFSRSGAFYR